MTYDEFSRLGSDAPFFGRRVMGSASQPLSLACPHQPCSAECADALRRYTRALVERAQPPKLQVQPAS